jgi:hypothetical protein
VQAQGRVTSTQQTIAPSFLRTTGLSAPDAMTLDAAGGKVYSTEAETSNMQGANPGSTSEEAPLMTSSNGPMGGDGSRYSIALATTR